MPSTDSELERTVLFAQMTEMRNEFAREKEYESPDRQLERSPSGSSVYESSEQQTVAIERRSRVHRSVCVLLVLLAALFVIILAVSLFALIALLLYPIPVASLSSTTPLITNSATNIGTFD